MFPSSGPTQYAQNNVDVAAGGVNFHNFHIQYYFGVLKYVAFDPILQNDYMFFYVQHFQPEATAI